MAVAAAAAVAGQMKIPRRGKTLATRCSKASSVSVGHSAALVLLVF
eukprot:COSAG05_NODE_18533_length_307_cov_0.538462_1_plen_45_part_01